jgi:hypothetical protein
MTRKLRRLLFVAALLAVAAVAAFGDATAANQPAQPDRGAIVKIPVGPRPGSGG